MIYAGLFLQIRRILILQQNKNVAASVCKNEIFEMSAAILFLSLLETEKNTLCQTPKAKAAWEQWSYLLSSVIFGKLQSLRNIQN